MKTNALSFALVGVGFLAVAIGLFLLWSNEKFAYGSVSVTDEYTATSTAPNAYQGAFTTGRLIKPGQGTLGSMVITGAGAGNVCFYNATTTAITKRASVKATSTILIACVAGSAAAGTYTFDSLFTDGLYIDLNPLDLGAGAMPTSTVTYR